MNEFLIKCKVPRIPPLFTNGNFVVSCKDKAQIFNTYFSEQCTPLMTDSVLPQLQYHTNERISTFDISLKEIKELLNLLKRKAHGPDEISVNTTAIS